jgi:hypothetical protein
MNTNSEHESNSSKARTLIQLGKFAEAIFLLTPELSNNRDHTLFNLFWCYYKLGDRSKIATLFSENIKVHGELSGLDKNIADSHYLSALKFILPPSCVSKIKNYSKSPKTDGEINELISILFASKSKAASYINDCANLFRTRYAEEYKFISQLPLDFYPYKYLCDYKSAVSFPSARITKKISIDFIYCIKNRPQRTLISLTSLLHSCEIYAKSNELIIKPRIVVVEDEDQLPFNAEWLISEASRIGLHASHLLTRTGVSWTRSGLLNIGIRRSESDLVAFVDSDFLFHVDFMKALHRVFLLSPIENSLFAINLIETESHKKNEVIFSKGSPYSYMWIAPTKTAKSVTGFDEGYVGHGFEDRDMELKLTRIGDLTVRDSLSIDPECFVMHLSHNARDGEEQRSANRARYLVRKSEKLPCSLMQTKWGVHTILSESVSIPLNFNSAAEVDFILVPHNKYHASTFLKLRDDLAANGYSALLLNISPPHPYEGALIDDEKRSYVMLSDIMNGNISAKAIVCMNDWENKIIRQMISSANDCGMQTIGIVEGVNDFDDVDTGFNRTAYTRVRHLLLNGTYDKKYFKNSKQCISVTGIQRIDALHPGMRLLKKFKRPTALVNVNFSYGVLKQYRDQWLREIANACEIEGYEMITSQHRADDADLSNFNRSDRPLYDLLAECSVFISRFSGAILEALAMGVNVVYYNPGFEKIDKFREPLNAYVWAKDQVGLGKAIKFFNDGGVLCPKKFLQVHCDIDLNVRADAVIRSSSLKTMDVLVDVVSNSGSAVVDFSSFRLKLGKQLVQKGVFAPKPTDQEILRLLSDTTFGIKSFGRSSHLTALVKSILNLYPSASILVCDDSGNDLGPLPKSVRLMQPAKLDIGLSAGRNLLLDECSTKYFVLLDDDFVFTDKTNIFSLVGALELYDIDIAGGAVFDIGPSAQKKDQPRTFYGSFDQSSDGTLTISTGRVRQWHKNLPLYDLVLNFFACRTDIVRNLRWTEALKLGEHLDFFIRARDVRLKVSYFPEVVVHHYRDHSANTEAYKAHRSRADGFHQSFRSMHSISKIYLNDSEIAG